MVKLSLWALDYRCVKWIGQIVSKRSSCGHQLLPVHGESPMHAWARALLRPCFSDSRSLEQVLELLFEYCQPFAKQNLIKLVKCYNWLKNKSTYVWIAATAVGYYVYVVTVCCGPGNKSDTIVDFGRKQLHCVTDCRLGSAALLWEKEKFTEEKMKNAVWA